MLRTARPEDRAAVEAIVDAAYSVYIERIGKPLGRMLDDYVRLIGEGAVSVLEDADGAIAALIVLLAKPDHLLLDNIAVRPDRQGRGLGRRLIAFAEDTARRLGYAQLQLYKHATMTQYIGLYTRVGFPETGAGREAVCNRAVMIQLIARTLR